MSFVKFCCISFLLLVFAGSSYAQEKHVPKELTALSELQVIPQFPGGRVGWATFLQDNLRIGRVAASIDSTEYANYGLRQNAILEFTICNDGEVCDVEVVNKNDVSPAFAEEAVRVMKESPRWIPGKMDGKPVNVRFKQTITAVLTD